MSTQGFSPCSNGSSIPRPTETPAGVDSAPVGGLHDSGAAAGDDRVPGPREAGPHGPGPLVLLGVAVHPRRPEDADRRPELGQRAEALDELGLDPQHPPGVGVHPVGGAAGVEEALVGGAALHLAPPEDHGTTALLPGAAGAVRAVLPGLRGSRSRSSMTPR